MRYHLVITDLVRSYYIESTNQESCKSAPSLLSTSRCEFNGVRSCAHARQTILFSLNHQIISTFILWRIYNPKFTDIHLAVSQLWPYKILPSINNIGARSSFSSPPPPPFQTVYIGGLRKPLLHLHTYTCLPYNSLISAWISIKFASVIILCSYVLSVNQLSARSKLLNAFKKSFYTVY